MLDTGRGEAKIPQDAGLWVFQIRSYEFLVAKVKNAKTPM